MNTTHTPIKHHTHEELGHDAGILLNFLLSKDKITTKDRLAIPCQEIPVQPAEERICSMTEVTLDFTPEQARLESMRCLQCKNPPCVTDCPVHIDIPGFIDQIAQGSFVEASRVIKDQSLLPEICGRVCPQEQQCQKRCTTGKSLKDLEQSVSIGHLERFAADWERKTGQTILPEIPAETGKKVAIVGSGPASLMTAVDCRKEGHTVVLYEAFHKLGGVMRYGIPEFRLPNSIIDHELSALEEIGIQIEKNFVVGRTRKIKDMLSHDGFDALFIGSGAGLPNFMGIPGEDAVGVFTANEYLTRANLMHGYDSELSDTPMYDSKKVAVLGGGNVAMDAARVAIRLGAEEVNVIYRRTETEMPARNEEIAHAKEERINFCFLQNATEIITDDLGVATHLKCIRYELGKPDDSGRRRPIAIDNSDFTMEIDTVIIAIGNSSNPLIAQTTPELELTKWKTLKVDDSLKTSMDGVYAGGDIVTGAATIIEAMGQGQIAAKSINTLLSS
ncbi:MAG: NADPH-dependent glutamate synthase [Fibrobacterales bacterium]